MLRLRTIVVSSGIVLGVATSAQADEPDKETCIASFDRGQRAQSDRALKRAQAELIVCAQESCPAVLRADCAGVLSEVRRPLPTVVLAADDVHAHHLLDVKVTSGGEVLATRLDGHAMPFDPGTYELTFETTGATPVKVVQLIHEGEKSRVVRASFRGLGGAGDALGADRPSPKRSAVGWALPLSLLALSAGAFVVAGVTRLSFDSGVDDLRATCAPECTQAQRGDLSSTLVSSNVALGAGIGLLGIAAVSWFLTAPKVTW